jgi:hypothetical protein
MTDNSNPTTPPTNIPEDQSAPAQGNGGTPDAQMNQRIDRLAGEPAPDITPEEFARLQKLGSLNLDSRGRIMLHREDGSDPGVSVRKRRAWYGR